MVGLHKYSPSRFWIAEMMVPLKETVIHAEANARNYGEKEDNIWKEGKRKIMLHNKSINKFNYEAPKN